MIRGRMVEGEVRVALLSRGGEIRRIYEENFGRVGVLVDAVDSFADLLRLLRERSYNGIALDLPLKFKIPRDEKPQEQEISSQFPTIQLNYDSNTGTIRSIYQGQIQGGVSLEDFVREECATFPPRRLRAHPRRQMHLPALLARAADQDAAAVSAGAEKTVTMDMSLGGCFVFTIGEFVLHDACYIDLSLLTSTTGPIRAEVRRKIAWGEALTVPGIGLAFHDLTEEQKEMLRSLLP